MSLLANRHIKQRLMREHPTRHIYTVRAQRAALALLFWRSLIMCNTRTQEIGVPKQCSTHTHEIYIPQNSVVPVHRRIVVGRIALCGAGMVDIKTKQKKKYMSGIANKHDKLAPMSPTRSISFSQAGSYQPSKTSSPDRKHWSLSVIIE